MNPPQESDEPPSRVHDEIVAAFARRNIKWDAPCPSCPVRGGWKIDARTYALLAMGTHGERPTPPDSPGFEVALTSCENCGYIRLHVLSVLVD